MVTVAVNGLVLMMAAGCGRANDGAPRVPESEPAQAAAESSALPSPPYGRLRESIERMLATGARQSSLALPREFASGDYLPGIDISDDGSRILFCARQRLPEVPDRSQVSVLDVATGRIDALTDGSRWAVAATFLPGEQSAVFRSAGGWWATHSGERVSAGRIVGSRDARLEIAPRDGGGCVVRRLGRDGTPGEPLLIDPRDVVDAILTSAGLVVLLRNAGAAGDAGSQLFRVVDGEPEPVRMPDGAPACGWSRLLAAHSDIVVLDAVGGEQRAWQWDGRTFSPMSAFDWHQLLGAQFANGWLYAVQHTTLDCNEYVLPELVRWRPGSTTPPQLLTELLAPDFVVTPDGAWVAFIDVPDTDPMMRGQPARVCRMRGDGSGVERVALLCR